MGIVIGAGSKVDSTSFSSPFSENCSGATQMSWDYSTNTERLYQLGSWAVCDDYSTPQQNLSLTFYSGATVGYDVSPTQECANEVVSAKITARGCYLPDIDGTGTPGYTNVFIMDYNDWFITGYNYAKQEARQPGTETWSLSRYTGAAGDDAPSFNIRGISEGTINSDKTTLSEAEDLSGVIFRSPVGNEAGPSVGFSGSVSAGQTGTAEFVYAYVVEQIGGSQGDVGETASASVQIPFTALWI